MAASLPILNDPGYFAQLWKPRSVGVSCSEDVELVSALEACGARIAWSCRPRVTTSARRLARAPGGFADALLKAVAQRLAAAAPHLPSLGTPS